MTDRERAERAKALAHGATFPYKLRPNSPRWNEFDRLMDEIGRVAPPPPPPTRRPYLVSHVGAMLRNPAGGVEDVQEMADAGIEWLGLNVSDHDPREWDVVRQRASAAGVLCVPKGRTAIPDRGDTTADAIRRLRLICNVAELWGVNCPVINLETEIKEGGLVTPAQVAAVMAEYRVDEAAISSEANLYWAVDWSPLHRYAVLLQMYPEDGKLADPTREKVAAWVDQCVRGARERAGFTYVGVTYQGWRSDPNWFDRSGKSWSVAFGDDVGAGNWWRWKP